MAYIDWEIRGPEITSCNCDWGCPCQFNSLPTHGFCRAAVMLRIDDDGLSAKYAPVLPPGWNALTLKDVKFRGRRYDIRVSRDADGKVVLSRQPLRATGMRHPDPLQEEARP